MLTHILRLIAALTRRAAVAVLLAVGVVLSYALPASAATDATTTHASLLSDTMVVAWLTTAVLGAVIPALTDLITKAAAPTWFKNIVVLVLAAVAAAIPSVTFVHGERWTDYLFQIFVAFWSALTAHRTGYSNAIQRAVPGGIGPVDPAKAYTATGTVDDVDSDADTGDTGGQLPPELPLSQPTNDLTTGGTV